MSYTIPTLDDLLEALLVDYRNQFPDADTSQGSLIYIKSACYASCLWGLYHYQEWIAKQIFPDTADSEYLEHHAWVRGVERTYGETDASLLERLLECIRRPPAGGNRYDYVKWAREVDTVAGAWCIPIPEGELGTVAVVVTANEEVTESELPSDSARIGVTTAVSAGKLIDGDAAFATGHAVDEGDVVENPLRETRTTVVSVDSDTQLSLADDIFGYAGDPYIVHCHCGSSTSTSEGKLIDAFGQFTDATYTIHPGDAVENRDDATETTVVSVDSDTQLTLADDIFTATGKHYCVRGLVARVKAHIDPLRPVTASRVTILGPTIVEEDVTMTVAGTGISVSDIAADVTSYMEGLEPGQTLYRAKLIQIAMEYGADNVVVTAPATDVTATAYEMIRPGTVSVS